MLPPAVRVGSRGAGSVEHHCEGTSGQVPLSAITLHLKRLVSRQIAGVRIPECRVRWYFRGHSLCGDKRSPGSGPSEPPRLRFARCAHDSVIVAWVRRTTATTSWDG